MTLKPTILTHDPAAEYFFEEGCHIIEHCNREDDPALSIAQARVEPGCRTRWHALRDTVERYQILSGNGLVDVGDQLAVPVAAGDTVLIPAGVRQRIHNTGREDLIFLALCTPRFHVENYQDLED